MAIPVRASPKIKLSTNAAKLPASMAVIMYGIFGSQRLDAMPASKVSTPTAVTNRLMSFRCVANTIHVSRNDSPRGIPMPKKLRSCAATIKHAAPAVKLMTTVCEIKFTSAPMRARPIASCITPARKVTVSASAT